MTVFGIVAHIDREEPARHLMAELQAEVMWLDDRPWESLQAGADRCTEGHLAVLEQMVEKVSTGWCVVLEDDAVPVPGFLDALDRALAAAPTRIVSLYLGTGNPSGPVQRAINEVIDNPAAWLISDALLATVGYAVHRSMLIDLITDVAAQRVVEMPKRITRWAQQIGMDIAYVHPSLVDHRDDDSVIYPGVPRHARLDRVAHRLGVRTTYTGTVALPHCPGWSREPATSS